TAPSLSRPKPPSIPKPKVKRERSDSTSSPPPARPPPIKKSKSEPQTHAELAQRLHEELNNARDGGNDRASDGTARGSGGTYNLAHDPSSAPPLPSPTESAPVDYATPFLHNIFPDGFPSRALVHVEESSNARLAQLDRRELYGEESQSDKGEEEDLDAGPVPRQKPPPQDLSTAFQQFATDGTLERLPGLNLSKDFQELPSAYHYTTLDSDTRLLRSLSPPHPPLLTLPSDIPNFEISEKPDGPPGGLYSSPPKTHRLINLLPGRSRWTEDALRKLCADVQSQEPKCVTGYAGNERIRGEFERGEGLEREKMETVLEELFFAREHEIGKLLEDIYQKHPLWFEYLYHLAQIREASTDLAQPIYIDKLRSIFEKQKDDIKEKQRIWKQEEMALNIRIEEQWTKPLNAPKSPLREREKIEDGLMLEAKRMRELVNRYGIPLRRLEARSKAEREGGALVWDDDHLRPVWYM
ncbi:hypothetical protein P7C70_g8068, partial [Phenoliferia sp. Uapishka_3]